MSDSIDPYAPPARSDDDEVRDQQALREIVLGWEKLRLLYNLILLLPGVGILAVFTIRWGSPWSLAVGGSVLVAIGANGAFFLGPLAELYLRGVFRNGESLGKGRWLIFGAGLVVSAGVFGVALIMGLA